MDTVNGREAERSSHPVAAGAPERRGSPVVASLAQPVHTPWRAAGVISLFSHGRAILARCARPSIPADRKQPRPETVADLFWSCVGIASALLLATGWPFAWIAEALR